MWVQGGRQGVSHHTPVGSRGGRGMHVGAGVRAGLRA